MGIASSLFYDSNNSAKQTLHRRIRPSEEQFSEQQDRWNALAEYLRSDLKERSNHTIGTWLQGSYKFATQVRPANKGKEFDIDLGVYFQWQGTPDDGQHSPKNLKSMVQQSLMAYSNDDVIEVTRPPKVRCSRIRFKGDFHIDVPGYHLDPNADKRALATEENIWELSDPKALYIWFKNQFEDYQREKARRLIRYIKCWVGLKFEDGPNRPSSTLLTVLVADAFKDIPTDKMVADDEAVLAVLEKIIERLNRNSKVVNPVDANEILSDRLTPHAYNDFIEKLSIFRSIATKALSCETVLAAADSWTEAYEQFFPLPDTEEIAKSIQEKTLLPVPLYIPDVAVRAVSKDNPSRSWNGKNRVGPIPKNCRIFFSVTNSTSLPCDSIIQWMVRNEGDEAENINDLGHKAGKGLNAEENSAYTGTHYMDCVVKQYGQPISMRRISVEVSGPPIVRPKSKKKPLWRSVPGRR